MSEWKITRVSQMAEILSGGTPKTEVEEYWNGNIPWLSVKDFAGDTRKVYDSEKHISELGLNSSATQLLYPGDLIISARGTVGEIAQIGKTSAFNQSCYGLRVADGYSSNYLYYMLKYQVRYLKSVANGAVFDTIVVKTFDRMKASVPDLPTQKRIADILSAYDDLIENNNRRIAILEKAAQELYKEWFVRFRFPGYETAKFENGLPEGWTIKRMNDFCYITDGTHDTPKQLDDGVPLVTGRCIKNGFVDFDDAYCISESDHANIKKRSGLSSGDILFSNIGTVGNCCVVDYSREFSVKNVIIFKPNDTVKTAYLYYWMTSSSMQEIFATQTNGASQQFVGLTFMRRYKIIVPKQEILTAYGDKILPILEQKRMLHNNNLNLVKQRDLLLPRLMSGKLEV